MKTSTISMLYAAIGALFGLLAIGMAFAGCPTWEVASVGSTATTFTILSQCW